jgi:hypothetical protein
MRESFGVGSIDRIVAFNFQQFVPGAAKGVFDAADSIHINFGHGLRCISTHGIVSDLRSSTQLIETPTSSLTKLFNSNSNSIHACLISQKSKQEDSHVDVLSLAG